MRGSEGRRDWRRREEFERNGKEKKRKKKKERKSGGLKIEFIGSPSQRSCDVFLCCRSALLLLRSLARAASSPSFVPRPLLPGRTVASADHFSILPEGERRGQEIPTALGFCTTNETQ